MLDRRSVPEDSRFRSGDYVTRDSLVVSFVNISEASPQDAGIYVSIPCFLSACMPSLSFATRVAVRWRELRQRRLMQMRAFVVDSKS